MRLLLAFVGLSLLFTTKSVFAYVPPSQFIVKTFANKHAGFKAIKIRSVVSALENGKTSSVRFNVVTYFDAQNRLLKSWAVDDAEKKLFRIERKADALTITDALVFESQVGDLTKLLRTIGIPIRTEEELLAMVDEEARRASEVAFISRWKNSVVWVIGKKDKTGESQLWMEKDSFLPLRVVLGSVDNSLNEVQFENYRFHHGFPYPKVITAFDKDGVAMIQEEIAEVTTNPSLLGLASSNGGSPQFGFTEAGNAAPSAIRDLIEQYFKMIR